MSRGAPTTFCANLLAREITFGIVMKTHGHGRTWYSGRLSGVPIGRCNPSAYYHYKTLRPDARAHGPRNVLVSGLNGQDRTRRVEQNSLSM